MDIEDIGVFFPLLQGGVKIPARVESTLDNLLHEQLGLDTEFVSERVTTIFLDGRPTDRLEDANVRNGSTIALSAAMPGVVGATLRRGSYYAAMRHDITSSPCCKLGSCKNGSVTVKLFNLLLHDLGPFILSKGIIITPSELAGLFSRMPDTVLEGCCEVSINGSDALPEDLRQLESLVLTTDLLFSVRFKEKT
jgi:hypothetical protein